MRLISTNPFNSYCWSNPNCIVENWYLWLNVFLNETIPKRTQHRAFLSPWISQSTSHLIECLNTARRRYKDMHTKVLKLKSRLEKCCGNDKIEYEQNLAAERSTGKLFKYFRDFKKSNISSLVFYKNEKLENYSDEAQLFSKFFASVYVQSSEFYEPFQHGSENHFLSNLTFEETEIESICEKLNVNKSKGPDELPPVLFRKCRKTISHSFFQIFTKILQTSIFPDMRKKALISPVFKKGKKADLENYRPVSYLTLPSKIFERIVFIRLYDYYNKTFNNSQFGF